MMDSKGISEYKMGQLTEVPQSTINSLFNKNNMPTIHTLQGLCKGLDIEVSTFFKLVEHYRILNQTQSHQSIGLKELVISEESSDLPSFEVPTLLTKYTLLSKDEQKLVQNLLDLFLTK